MSSANRLHRSSRVAPIGVLALLFAFVGAVAASPQRASQVPEELLQKAQRLGSVRVSVQVRVDAGADEQAIEATKAAVLYEIMGAAYRVVRPLRGPPTIGMEASYDALIGLDASAGVLRVEEDALARPQGA